MCHLIRYSGNLLLQGVSSLTGRDPVTRRALVLATNMNPPTGGKCVTACEALAGPNLRGLVV